MSKICIAGKNDIASNGLEFVNKEYGQSHDVVALPNANDTGKHSWQKSLLATATSLNIPVVGRIEELYNIKDLLFVSLECDKLIKVDKFCSRRLYNIHFSRLPQYRGMYTSIMPILDGRKTSGVTLHVIDYGIDTGDIIAFREFEIDDNDTSRDLYFKYNSYAFDLFSSSIENLITGNFKARPQDVEGASYYSKSSIDFSRLHVDLRKTAFEVKNQIRAYAFVEYQLPVVFGKDICFAEILPERSRLKPGTLVEQDEKYIVVSTIDYNVKMYLNHSACGRSSN